MIKRCFMKWTVVCVLAAISVLIAGIVFFKMRNPWPALPAFQSVRDSYEKSDMVLLDRHGVVIHELRVDNKSRRLDWTGLNVISPALKNAVIYSEDKRFHKHNGVDFKAVGAAVLKNLTSGGRRGASTITMQLASTLDVKLKSKKKRRSFFQKLDQMRQAVRLEEAWSKGEILEAYLNTASFRGELQGVASASRGLFGKEPHGLNIEESLILASLLRAPNATYGDVAKRACRLGAAMPVAFNCGEVAFKTSAALTRLPFISPRAELAPHVAEQLLRTRRTKSEAGSYAVVSTLDAGLQSFTAGALAERLASLRMQNVRDGAILVVENATGNVLAYVGSSGGISGSPHVDGIRAKRQAGSTLKPFLYGIAFNEKLITAASIIGDSPLNIPVAGGTYRPKNYDNKFRGLVSARAALASSLNVPALKVLHIVGMESFLTSLRMFGVKDIDEPADFYGPALALGSADVSLWELVNAYRVLANDGVWSELKITPSGAAPPRKRVLSREAAFLVSDILSDRGARSYAFGLENPLSTRFWTAVKTGTSKDMRDNWCIGYSAKYTVGVWVGNFSGEPMWDVSGVSGAAPVWGEIMNRLHHNEYSMEKKPPRGVMRKAVSFAGIEDDRLEWFVKGTEFDSVRPVTARTDQKITYPVEGTIIALDPDIPEGQQAVLFESQNEDNTVKWVLNGKNMGGAGSTIVWFPDNGRHTLSLVDNADRVLDAVNFEVR